MYTCLILRSNIGYLSTTLCLYLLSVFIFTTKTERKSHIKVMVSKDEVHVVTDIVPIAGVFRNDHDAQCHSRCGTLIFEGDYYKRITRVTVGVAS